MMMMDGGDDYNDKDKDDYDDDDDVDYGGEG